MKRIVDKFTKIKISKYVLAWLFVILFIVSLIPIIITMFFSVPIWDDYAFGLRAHLSFKSGNGFWSGVFESCEFFFNNWQGFFTANFIASSQPYVIDERLYFISNFLFFGVFLFAMFFFAKVLLRDVLHTSKTEYVLVSIPIIGYLVQLLPSAAEGIYWMDGSLAMMISGLVLLLISLIIKYMYLQKKKEKIICIIMLVLLSAICSGAIIMDYVSCLMMFIYACVYLFIRRRKQIWVIILSFAILSIGVVVSVLAPGNAVRAELLTGGLSIPLSIVKALLSSFEYFNNWFGLSFFAVLIFLALIMWNTLKESSFSFKHPLLVFILSYSLYSGRMSVQYYAGGYLGAPRQMNQYFLGFIICMTLSWIYFIGWLTKRKTFRMYSFSKKINLLLVIVLVGFFLLGTFKLGIGNFNSVATGSSLLKGKTQAYHNEMEKRIALYNDPSIKDVEVYSLEHYPRFFGKPLQEGSDDWTNMDLAKYYQKNSVTVIDRDK